MVPNIEDFLATFLNWFLLQFRCALRTDTVGVNDFPCVKVCFRVQSVVELSESSTWAWEACVTCSCWVAWSVDVSYVPWVRGAADSALSPPSPVCWLCPSDRGKLMSTAITAGSLSPCISFCPFLPPCFDTVWLGACMFRVVAHAWRMDLLSVGNILTFSLLYSLVC